MALQAESARRGRLALDHRIDLAQLRSPLFLLAARADELVAPEQVFATARRVGTPASDIERAIAPGEHLGLFMGGRTLRTIWPRIARWLGKGAEPRHSARSAVVARSGEGQSRSLFFQQGGAAHAFLKR